MQRKSVTALPAGENWTFEIKFDGYRCIVGEARERGHARFSRHKKVLNKRFPGVVDALTLLGSDFVLDGELVALDSQGRPSFQLLQNNLLNRNGELLVDLSIERRRELLAKILAVPEDRYAFRRYCERHRNKFLRRCANSAWEGVVGKRIGSIYEPGERSGAWIKHRVNREQEFVVGGYVPGRHGFDALLVGVYKNKQLIFVAKVKNGFVPRIRDEIFPALKKLRILHCPFANLPEKRALRWGESLTAEKMKECYWVTPKLVCQVAFVEWTDAWHLRHCTFVAMRDDKRPADVVRET